MAEYLGMTGPAAAYFGVRDKNQQLGDQAQAAQFQQATSLMGLIQAKAKMEQDAEMRNLMATGNIDEIAKRDPARASSLIQLMTQRAALDKAQKEQTFNKDVLPTFMTQGQPAQPGVQSVAFQGGVGPDRPAVEPRFDVRGALEAKVRAGLIDPLTYQKELDALTKPVAIGRGGLAARDAAGNWNQVVAPAPAVAPASNLSRQMAERDALIRANPNDPNIAVYNDAIRKATTHAPAPSANVTVNQEKEESKAVGKFFGENYADIQKSSITSQQKLTTLKRMDQLLEGVNTGRLTPIGTEIASVAQSLGVNIDRNLGNKQAATALGNEIALQLRNPSGGAGMPGALSDKDREFLVSMVPGLSTTPEGRKQIIETAKKLAQRDIDVAKMARNYQMRNKTIDEGFYSELADYSAKNNMFSSGSTQTPAPASGWKIERIGQ